eukprot:TRINITY_DN5152_c0_g1_i2.p1 TRINITY_DN5152_c0_g1~~TRINITY_DN5152_c0_g1_i2.p1  ORF type:complete len:495 (+),score=112.98 TRINITY_DN5152_c0_g1_i2:82-1566(+)
MAAAAGPCFTALTAVLVCLFTLLDWLLWLLHLPLQWFRGRHHGRSSSSMRANDSDPEELRLTAGGGRKVVVIVGCNFAGLSALWELAEDPAVQIIVIDQRDYFEYVPGVLRLFCEPELFSTMAREIPAGNWDFMPGTVTSVSTDHVVVSFRGGDEQRIDLDYLILATGADYRYPITPTAAEKTLASRRASWDKAAAEVRAAQSVLILGGGAVGAELAAEIVCYYPGKKVTIVDGAKNLVPLFPQKTIDYVEQWFRNRGTELILEAAIDSWDTRSCTLRSGRVIEADLVYVCFGLRCNSQCVSKGNLLHCLSERKEVRVNDHLQVEGAPNVFAAGDVMVNPSREIKQAYYAEMNGKTAAMNVKRLIRGDSLLRYPDHMAGAPVMPLVYVVSLGRYDGSLGFNTLVLNGFITAVVKWIIEWTKVAQMEGRHVGALIWEIGDAFTFLLSRTCVKPVPKAMPPRPPAPAATPTPAPATEAAAPGVELPVRAGVLGRSD